MKKEPAKTAPSEVTPYRAMCDRWASGCGSSHCPPLAGRPTRVAMFRGSVVPCDVLFIGEGPGESENAGGRPFVGPAGHLLDSIVEAAFKAFPALTWGFGNVVGCIPRDADDPLRKAKEPDDDQVKDCTGRLQELAAVCKPRLVVCVGKFAADRIGEKARGLKQRIHLPGEPKTLDVIHPAAILKAATAAQGLMIQRCVVTLRDAAEELTHE